METTYLVEFEDGKTRELTLPETFVEGQEVNVSIEFFETVSPPTITRPTTCRGVLQHHWWEAEKKPVRVGPSTEHWDLRIEWDEKKPLMQFVCYFNLMYVDETSAIYKECPDHEWMEKGKKREYLPPGTEGNPTKKTPAYIEIVDSGKVIIYESSDDFVKFDIRFKTLKGHFVAIRREERLNLWVIRRESPKPGG
ncbi:MAG: hypothetical protein ACTSYJ_11480 [Candidatus Thorarchaeota archaeon]